MLRELLKANLNNSVNIQVAKILGGRPVVPVTLLCILIFVIKQKKVVSDDVVYTGFLLRHKCGCGDSAATVFEQHLHGCNISYFGNEAVLDGCGRVTLDIRLDIERWDKDYDGLWADGGREAGV